MTTRRTPFGKVFEVLCSGRPWSLGRMAIGMVACATLLVGSAVAGEEDDLQRQIDTQRTGVNDLVRLDEMKAATEEVTMLRTWLDEAWALRAKHEYDQVREVLDRCLAQADLVRQKSSAAKMRAQAQKREAALAEVRAKIDHVRKALQEMLVKKKALEVTVK